MKTKIQFTLIDRFHFDKSERANERAKKGNEGERDRKSNKINFILGSSFRLLLAFVIFSHYDWTNRIMFVLSIIKFNYSEFFFVFVCVWINAVFFTLSQADSLYAKCKLALIFRLRRARAAFILSCLLSRKHIELRIKINWEKEKRPILDSILSGYYCHWSWNDYYNRQFAVAREEERAKGMVAPQLVKCQLFSQTENDYVHSFVRFFLCLLSLFRFKPESSY